MKIKGLILKDIYQLWAQSRIVLLLIAVYLLLPVFMGQMNMLGSVALILLAMLPVYALGYDERCRWERYALAMPVRKRDIFLGKLLLGGIAIVLGAAVQAAAALLAGRAEMLPSLGIAALAALAYLLVSLPLMIKLGVEKGRFLLILLTAAFLAISGALL